MTAVSIGAYHHWPVTNETLEVHPFHIHQVHFLIYTENGVRLESPEWLDTVNVPVQGNVDLMMDFYRSDHPRRFALPLPSAEP